MVKEQICTQLNIWFKFCLHRGWRANIHQSHYISKKLFASWFKSEAARNKIYQSKCCLNRDYRANIYKIQYISQNVVYSAVEELIYTQLNIWFQKLFTAWWKSEYLRNSIYQSKNCLHCDWRGNMCTIQYLCQKLFTSLLKK
jgi:hypothetical protein